MNQLEFDAVLGGNLDPDDARLDVAERTRHVGQRHAEGGVFSKQVRFWGHNNAAHVFLELISQRAELGVVLRQSRREESQEGPSWVHVDLTWIRGGERGDIGTVGEVDMLQSVESPHTVTWGEVVERRRQLGAVVSVRVHEDMRILFDFSNEELASGSARTRRRSKHTHGVTKAEDFAIFDVQVDVCIGHFDAANDLADIDVCNAGSVVGV